MDELHGNGTVVLAGPYKDRTRVLTVVRCSSQAEAEHLFEKDNWTDMKILEMDGVHEWEPFLKPASWPNG